MTEYGEVVHRLVADRREQLYRDHPLHRWVRRLTIVNASIAAMLALWGIVR